MVDVTVGNRENSFVEGLDKCFVDWEVLSEFGEHYNNALLGCLSLQLVDELVD